MNATNFDALSNRAVSSAIEQYGVRVEATGELDRIEVYNGPNIRAFMTEHNLPPSKWRDLLDYNRFGSVMSLVEGESQLAVPFEF